MAPECPYSIPHIQELWKESYVAVQEIEVPASSAVADPFRDITNFFIIIGLVVFLIFAHRRILSGLKYVLTASLSFKKLQGIENQSNLQICRDTLFFFLTICSSFVFANIAYATKIIGSSYTVPIKFAGIVAVIMLFFFLRHLALRFLDWQNKSRIFKHIHKISYTYACLWYIVVLCCFVVIKSIPSAPMGTMRYCIIYSTLAILLPYFSSIYKIFIPKGFSHFFYILYLCTLEILPILLLLYLNFN